MLPITKRPSMSTDATSQTAPDIALHIDDIRRKVAGAERSEDLQTFSNELEGIIAAIDEQTDAIEEKIAAEAENLDRAPTMTLRQSKAAMLELLTDAENLCKRANDKRDEMIRRENEEQALAVANEGRALNQEARELIPLLAAQLEGLMALTSRYNSTTERRSRIVNRLTNDMNRRDLYDFRFLTTAEQNILTPGKLANDTGFNAVLKNEDTFKSAIKYLKDVIQLREDAKLGG